MKLMSCNTHVLDFVRPSAIHIHSGFVIYKGSALYVGKAKRIDAKIINPVNVLVCTWCINVNSIIMLSVISY